MFTHTAVHSAPKAFLLIFLNDVDGRRLTHHLVRATLCCCYRYLHTHVFQNDHIFISHYHDPEDGFANLEEGSEWVEDDRASLSSVVHRSVAQNATMSPEGATILTQEVKPSAHTPLHSHNLLFQLGDPNPKNPKPKRYSQHRSKNLPPQHRRLPPHAPRRSRWYIPSRNHPFQSPRKVSLHLSTSIPPPYPATTTNH